MNEVTTFFNDRSYRITFSIDYYDLDTISGKTQQ